MVAVRERRRTDGLGEEAKIHLLKLQAKEVTGYEDLYMDAAETCWAVGRVGEAEVMYTALREVEVYDQPALWAKIAACIRARIGESSSDAAFTATAAADAVIEFYKSAGGRLSRRSSLIRPITREALRADVIRVRARILHGQGLVGGGEALKRFACLFVDCLIVEHPVRIGDERCLGKQTIRCVISRLWRANERTDGALRVGSRATPR